MDWQTRQTKDCFQVKKWQFTLKEHISWGQKINSFETFKTHKYLSQRKPPALPNNINPCPMHNPTKNAYNTGLVFRVLQYLNSDIKIYPTATIILKFWVVLEQTFCKKRHTVNPGIPEHGTAEHPRTVADNGTLAEYPRIPTTFWKSIKVFSVK